jgi:hypothetical protein
MEMSGASSESHLHHPVDALHLVGGLLHYLVEEGSPSANAFLNDGEFWGKAGGEKKKFFQVKPDPVIDFLFQE